MTTFGDTRLPARFWAKVKVQPSGCWEWQGHIAKSGYGKFGWKGESRVAHRVGYEAINGALPPGLSCDHLCRNRKCVNPSHLEPVTPSENAKRGKTGHHRKAESASMTHCLRGHPVEGNRYFIPGRPTQSRCTICARDKKRSR